MKTATKQTHSLKIHSERSISACQSEFKFASMNGLPQEVQKKLDEAIAVFNGRKQPTIEFKELGKGKVGLMFNSKSNRIQAIHVIGKMVREYQEKYRQVAAKVMKADISEIPELLKEGKEYEEICHSIWYTLVDLVFTLEPPEDELTDCPVPLAQAMREYAPSESHIAYAYVRCMKMEIPDPGTHSYIGKLLPIYGIPEAEFLYHDLITKYESQLPSNPKLALNIRGLKRGLESFHKWMKRDRRTKVDIYNLSLI